MSRPRSASCRPRSASSRRTTRSCTGPRFSPRQRRLIMLRFTDHLELEDIRPSIGPFELGGGRPRAARYDGVEDRAEAALSSGVRPTCELPFSYQTGGTMPILERSRRWLYESAGGREFDVGVRFVGTAWTLVGGCTRMPACRDSTRSTRPRGRARLTALRAVAIRSWSGRRCGTARCADRGTAVATCPAR
jgi:hypothetical protein